MTSATRRTHAPLHLLLAGAVLAAVVLLATAGLARAGSPPPITDNFATGDDGWEIYEGTSEYRATWKHSGGNPGGYIRYSDSDSSRSSAVFADENYVSHISRYIGAGHIVFDLKTDATDARTPRVWITDPDNPNFPAIHTDLKRAPDANWHHYDIPIDAGATRWVDGNGNRVGAARFRKILDRNPVFVVRADYSSAAPEQTDFDSVGIGMFVTRTLTLSYKAKTKKLKGRLTGSQPSTPSCTKSQKVTVMRVKTGADEKIGSATTNKASRYSLVRKSLKHGRYYAITAETNPVPGLICEQAKSKKIKRK